MNYFTTGIIVTHDDPPDPYDPNSYPACKRNFDPENCDCPLCLTEREHKLKERELTGMSRFIAIDIPHGMQDGWGK